MTLGDEEEPGRLIGGELTVSPTGSLLVLPPGGTGVQLYSSTGHHLLNLGREGAGPGEFLGVADAAAVDTLVYIVDARRRRLLSFTIAGELAGDYPFPLVGGEILVPHRDTAIVAVHDRHPDRIGLPISIVHVPSGAVARSTGSITGRHVPRSSYDEQFLLAPVPDEPYSVWFARRSELRFERWNLSADALEAVAQGRPDWFPLAESTLDGTAPPPTILLDFVVDRQGRLWTLSRVAADDWQQFVTTDESSPHGLRVTDMAGVRDVRLDVYDMANEWHVRGPIWDDIEIGVVLSPDGDALLRRTMFEARSGVEHMTISRMGVERRPRQ